MSSKARSQHPACIGRKRDLYQDPLGLIWDVAVEFSRSRNDDKGVVSALLIEHCCRCFLL